MTGLAGNFAKLELLYQGNNNKKKKTVDDFGKKEYCTFFKVNWFLFEYIKKY